MRIPPGKIALVFAVVTAVSGVHLYQAVSAGGWTFAAVGPVAVAYALMVATISGLFYYLTRPAEGADPGSVDAWTPKTRPLFKWLVPVSLLIHVVLLVRLLMG